MLKELEKLFGFRTSETTNVSLYLKKMDEMSKFDDNKQNHLIAVMIDHIMALESTVADLRAAALTVEAPVAPDASTKQELATIKGDITRIKKIVYAKPTPEAPSEVKTEPSAV